MEYESQENGKNVTGGGQMSGRPNGGRCGRERFTPVNNEQIGVRGALVNVSDLGQTRHVLHLKVGRRWRYGQPQFDGEFQSNERHVRLVAGRPVLGRRIASLARPLAHLLRPVHVPPDVLVRSLKFVSKIDNCVDACSELKVIR